ncbi:MAG: transporter related protein [Actinomycetia bacterium]|nr:transporter related protein [Actinomycetes bacterium]
MALLETHDIVVAFGGNRALDGISLDVEAGRITGLIGPNGAGKTTMFNVVTGLLAPGDGQVILDGKDITKQPPHKRAQLGLARTFQRLELFTSLTVRDNIRVAGEIRNHWGLGDNMDATTESERIIELVGLQEVADREVSEIPTGTARVVELGRALMTKPRVLLLDEPASGQTEQETRAFGQLLGRLVADGLAICLVEHDMALVMEVCAVIHVLDYGRMIAVGTPDEIRGNQAVIDAYLGAPAGM